MHKRIIAIGIGMMLSMQVMPTAVLAYGGGGFTPAFFGINQGRVLGAATTTDAGNIVTKTAAQVEQERIIAFIQRRIQEIRWLLEAYRILYR